MENSFIDDDVKEIEEKLIAELTNPDLHTENETLGLPMIDSKDDYSDVKRITRLVDTLAGRMPDDKDILSLLMYIAGIENNPDIAQAIRAATDNFAGYGAPEKQVDDDLFAMITEDPHIIDNAFDHALKNRSLSVLEYILEGADKVFINATINDDQILSLIEGLDEVNNQRILKYLPSKDITLENETQRTTANEGRLSQMSAPGIKGNEKSELGWEEMTHDQQNNNSKRSLFNRSMRRVEDRTLTKRQKQKKKNPFTKFLQKADIVEIALRALNISDEEEKRVITLLYDKLHIPTNETVALFKLLIYYEEVNTFEKVLKYRMKGPSNQDPDAKDVAAEFRGSKVVSETEADFIPGRKDNDNIYDYDEIISDAFSYAISMNKLPIAFYLFKTYEDDVYGNKQLCVESIIESFKNDETQVNQVMYLEERLFILEKFMKFVEYKLALEFLTVIHQQISDDPKTNFLVFCPNPLKMIVMLLNIVISLSNKHQNLKFKAQKVRSSLCDIANGIIDTSNSMNEVEDMLLDKTYSGTEILDFIEILDIIEILTNPMIDSIISNMYLGPYERESFMKRSV